MTDVYSSSTSVNPALLRRYGAGMIDAYAAYCVINENRYRFNNTSTDFEFQYNIPVTQKQVDNNKDIFLSLNWMQNVIKTQAEPNNETSYSVLNGFHHELQLYDPEGILVAKSNFLYDRKQFIRYTPLQKGTYKIKVIRSYSVPPAYYPNFAVAYTIK